MDRTDEPGSMLQLSSVTKSYSKHPVVSDVSLDVAAGEFLTFLGPSGSGKTTTLNMIAGLAHPDSGTIRLRDTPIESLPSHRRNIGMVFQDYALFPHMTVRDNIEFPLKQRKVASRERRRLVDQALELVELGAMGGRRPAQLSGGQRQRVALARATVFSPDLLLMDEPLGALDRQLREVMQIEIRRLHLELGVTVIYVTHDQSEAFAMSDRVVIFNEGKVEQVGTPTELYREPASVFVAKFLGDSNVFRGTYKRDGESEGILFGGAFLKTSGRRASPSLDGAAAMIVRPEDMHMVTSPSEGRNNVVDAVVLDVRYFGSEQRVWIELTDGSTSMLRLPPTERVGIQQGDKIRVSWRFDAGVLLNANDRRTILSDMNERETNHA